MRETYDYNGLVFDGSLHFGMTFPTFVHGVQLLGNYQAPTGTGILFTADDGFVGGVCLSQMGVSYFAKGAHLRSTGDAWVNPAPCIVTMDTSTAPT